MPVSNIIVNSHQKILPMKLSIFVLSFFVIGLIDYSQPIYAQDSNSSISPTELREITTANRIPVHRSVNIQGSPFLFDDFYEGKVSLKNGHISQSLPIRYNSHEQNIEFMDNNSAYILDGEEIEWFELNIGDDSYKFRKGFDASRLTPDDFVQVLAEGELTFLVRHSTSFQQNVASYGTATRQDRYLSTESYFIKAGKDSPDRIRSLRERRVMRYIDRYNEEVETFAKQHNIDFSDAADVAKLIKYYNSLVSK
jgi:hypothetical protein